MQDASEGRRIWWYANGSQQQGPVSREELIRIAQSGGLEPDALVWREGLPEWVAASSMRELQPAAAPETPAAPPPVASIPAAPVPATAPAWAQASSSAEPPWFAVSTTKLLVMSLCTLTFYNIFWLYQNWVRVQQRERSDIWPIARTIFAIFFIHGLFKRVVNDAEAAQLRPTYDAMLMTVLFIAIALTWRLPDPWSWISALQVLVMMQVQALANQVNAAVAPDHDRNERYSGVNIAGIVVGGLFLVMAVLGSFIEEEGEDGESPRRKPASSAPVAMLPYVPQA